MTERERGKMEEAMPSFEKPFPTQGDRYRYALEVIARSGNKTMASVAVEALAEGQHLPLAREPQPSGAGEGLEALVAKWRAQFQEMDCQLHAGPGYTAHIESHCPACVITKCADELEAALRHSTPSAPTLDWPMGIDEAFKTWWGKLATGQFGYRYDSLSTLDIARKAFQAGRTVEAGECAARGTPSAGEDEK